MMGEKIGTDQLTVLVANFIFTGTLISLPQSLAELSGQNSWYVPIVGFLMMGAFIYVLLGSKQQLPKFSKKFLAGKRTILEKMFLVVFATLFVSTFIRDVRGLVDFIATVLLPTTPIDVLTILAILIIVYLASGGLEVIARVTAIHFGVLAIIILVLPFMMLNEINVGNFQPVFSQTFIPDVTKSSFILFSWVGEAIFILLLIGNMEDVRKTRRAAVKGIGAGMFLLAILLALMVAVLGVDIVKASSYPSHQLIQQINLTDFLDRLDLVIVTVWIPAFITKISLDLYLINRCLTSGRHQDVNVIIVPLGIALGMLSILLFRNNMEHLQFSFYTWAAWGLGFELLIGILFFVKRKFT
jgi:spore germination protein